LGTSKNSDFFWQALAPAEPAYMPSMAISANDPMLQKGAYVQDVRYADFAGAKIGGAAKAGPSEAALGLAGKDN
jgi:hypothetical protein